MLRRVVLIFLFILVSEKAYGQRKGEILNLTPPTDTDRLEVVFDSTYENEKPFELFFPVAYELVLSKYTPLSNFPAGAIGFGSRNFQVGIKGALNGFHGAGGNLRVFFNIHTSRFTMVRERAYFLAFEGGSAFRKNRNNRARFGLGLGYLHPIGKKETPAVVRLQLTPFLDWRSGQIEPGFSASFGIGLPLGWPESKPKK
ncbi:MAG: hypothetical protein G01um101420_419 [Parcubacteria group bacterium Gr01-1014_20]|nr:MAG: hypothetical protein G01um101420_419 [Parcubacteria group bacterium Gr01-1014_20]